jgi:hypothetical protein
VIFQHGQIYDVVINDALQLGILLTSLRTAPASYNMASTSGYERWIADDLAMKTSSDFLASPLEFDTTQALQVINLKR